MQATAAGTLPPAPIAVLVGYAITHVAPGLVHIGFTPAEYHYNPIGTVHGGIAATVLESALAAAIRTTLPPGQECTTVEIKVTYVRAMTTATGTVTAEGRAIHTGRQVAMAEGRITDAQGRLYATASSTCLLQEPPPPQPAPLPHRPWVVEWGDPMETAQRISGLPGLEALRDHDFAPPVAHLIGMGVGSIEPGRVRMVLAPGGYLFSQFGAVHGGAAATLLDSVLGCSIHTTLPAGRGFTTLELKVSLLRPMLAGCGLITATGSVLHSGRRMATSEAQAVDADGHLCATATTTCLVFDMRGAG